MSYRPFERPVVRYESERRRVCFTDKTTVARSHGYPDGLLSDTETVEELMSCLRDASMHDSARLSAAQDVLLRSRRFSSRVVTSYYLGKSEADALAKAKAGCACEFTTTPPAGLLLWCVESDVRDGVGCFTIRRATGDWLAGVHIPVRVEVEAA